MNPIEVLLIFLESEIRTIFRDIKNRSYSGLTEEIFIIIEEAIQKAIAAVYGISIEDVEDARVLALDEVADEVRETITEEDGKKIIIRDFNNEFIKAVFKRLGLETKEIKAVALLVAEPLAGVVGNEAYILHLQVAICEDGYIKYYETYTLQKVPRYSGGLEIIAIPADHLEIDIDCECSCPGPEDFYGVVRSDGSVDLYRR